MRKGCCKHYIGYHKGRCKLGIDYRELVGGPDFGWAVRLPCLKTALSKPGPECGRREEPTDAEIVEWLQEMDALLAAEAGGEKGE